MYVWESGHKTVGEGGARIRFEEVCCLVFTASMKREIRHFHVVVVQRR